MQALTDWDLHLLRGLFTRWNCKPSHADRLLRAFYSSGGVVDIGALKLGKALEERLAHEIAPRQSRVVRQHASADGTVKFLIGFDGGGAVEAVLMPTPKPERAAGCISSQLGCAMGCDFCASTRNGFERDLASGEIVEQFLHLRRAAKESGRRLSTLVFMGMGEPLENLDNVIPAIQRIVDPKLGAFGARQIMVSTVGIITGIDRLAASGLNVCLAVSLHAADDTTRSRIVPSARRYPLAEIIAAAKRFQHANGLVTNMEYCMLGGVNDSDGDAHALAELLAGLRTHVNLIPYNSIGAGLSGVVYQPPALERQQSFLAILRQHGLVAHFRKTRGDDVSAACGQLAGADR